MSTARVAFEYMLALRFVTCVVHPLLLRHRLAPFIDQDFCGGLKGLLVLRHDEFGLVGAALGFSSNKRQ